MLDHAVSIGTQRAVQWQQADGMQLPFPDQSFDLVLCQFGVMFFPDKPNAFSQIWRVLRPGGSLIFSTRDNLDQNELAALVQDSFDHLEFYGGLDGRPYTTEGLALMMVAIKK